MMIYLLAILWFASGFFGYAYITVFVDKQDFAIPSIELIFAIFCGIVAPLAWIFVTMDLLERSPKITLFKARNK